jgi:hypothetical protein
MFLEAWIRLIWARLLLRCLSFRKLTCLFNLAVCETAVSLAEREQLRRDVSWAIARACDWLPGATVCFPRAITAQIMCRKRGIDSSMYYGVARESEVGLRAHVWVKDGSVGVVGHLVANQYAVLARFPA